MKYVIGIDEVGRGSLAGPVTVCAALVPSAAGFRWVDAPSTLKDSKRLSPNQREAWVRYLHGQPDIVWAVASVSARTVDRIGIRNAANRAAGRVYRGLLKRASRARRASVTLDAGLSIGAAGNGARVQSFPKADERIPAVAIASIIAKVHRDAYMRRLHRRFPAYGFGAHKGYGTKAHRAAVRRRGPSSHHRLTFCGLGLRRPAGATKPQPRLRPPKRFLR